VLVSRDPFLVFLSSSDMYSDVVGVCVRGEDADVANALIPRCILMVVFWEDAGVLRLNARDEGIKLVQHAMSDIDALVNFILLWYVVYYVCVVLLVDASG